MAFFRPDLWRSFTIGFALSAAALLGAMGPDGRAALLGEIVPSALAQHSIGQ